MERRTLNYQFQPERDNVGTLPKVTEKPGLTEKPGMVH